MRDVLGTSKAVRFGVFEVDLEAGELHKNGLKVKLQEQPFQVLALLLERAGEVVTGEELCASLWPDGTFVEFDRSLNIAVNKIREALGDSAASPRFVETVPRRGYRFIAPVEKLGPAPPAGATAAPPSPPRRRVRAAWMVLPAAVAAVGAVLWYSGWRTPGEKASPRIVPLTSYPGQELYPTFSPDGNEIAFAWNGAAGDNFDIYRLPIGAVEPLRLTHDPAEDFSPAWSPDGRLIAFKRVLAPGKTAVFLIPALGGSEQKVLKATMSDTPDPRHLAVHLWPGHPTASRSSCPTEPRSLSRLDYSWSHSRPARSAG